MGKSSKDLYIMASMIKHAICMPMGPTRADVFENAATLSVELATEEMLEIRIDEEGWNEDQVRDGEAALALMRDRYQKKVVKMLRLSEPYTAKVSDFRLSSVMLYLASLFDIACDEIDAEMDRQESLRTRDTKQLPPPEKKAK
jgi:hypothetical protein